MLKRRLKKLITAAVTLVLFVAVLPTSAEALQIWHTEKVASDQHYIRGMGYDANGMPAFVQDACYSNPRTAIYRYKTESGTWRSETVSVIDDEPKLAFNSSKQPYILYSHDRELYLAKRVSEDNWQQVGGVIDTGFMDEYSLDFDSAGNPCVSYSKYDNLYYASYDGSAWKVQFVYKAYYLMNNALAMNGSTPAIVFQTGLQGLKYASYSGGKWNVETVDTSTNDRFPAGQQYLTLRFGNGTPLVSYKDTSANSLKFAYRIGGQWTAATLEASSGGSYAAESAVMQVYKKGSGYVIYIAHGNYMLSQTANIKLKTLEVNSDNDLKNLNFVSETVQTDGFRTASPQVVCAVKNGNPGIMYFNFFSYKTIYISKEPKLIAENSVSFGSVLPGDTLTRDITIINDGSVNLDISEITGPSGPYRITGGGSGSLAPGASRVITVHFEPVEAGTSYYDTVSIKSNDPDKPVFNISLSGRTIGNSANLTGLSFSNGSSLSLNPEETECSLTVDFTTENIRITPIAQDPYAFIMLEGSVIQNETPSADIPLAIGNDNYVEISLTSEDETTNKTYTLNIMRKDSPDASLSGLEVSTGLLTPAFNPEITAYTLVLPDGVTGFTITPTATPMVALGESTISINGTPVTNNEPYDFTAEVGKNTYTINVVAPDNESERDYVVNVIRLPEISGITLDHGVLDKSFDPYSLEYNVTVPNSVQSLLVTPSFGPSCNVTVNGNPAPDTVWLETGENVIEIRAVSLDDEVERIYTLTVTRLPGLNSLVIGDTYMSIWESQTDYSVIITDAECRLYFPTPEGMSVSLTGPLSESIDVSEDGVSEPLSFIEGMNGPYTIQLISPECAEITEYTLTVYRRPLLTSLQISGNAIELWPDRITYAKSIPNATDCVTISAAASAGSNVYIDPRTNLPVSEENGVWTVENLPVGAFPIYLVTESGDAQARTDYLIVIQRLPGLSSLSVSEGTLNPAFSTGTFDYTVNVGQNTTSITINADVNVNESGYPEGYLSVNGTPALIDTYSGEIELSYGSNIIHLLVTADEYYGSNALYTLNVIRQEPDAGAISISSAGFDKYESAEGYRDIDVEVVTTTENPFVALKNGDNTLLEDTHYTVSGSIYTLKKEYLATLPTGGVSITFDFTYGDDPVLTVRITDSDPTKIREDEQSPSGYQARVSGGGTVPVSVNTDGSAQMDLGTVATGLQSGSDMVVEVGPIQGVRSYTANMPSSAITSGDGTLTMVTGIGSVAIPGNMLLGTGLTGSAGVTIGTVDKSGLPEDVQAAIGHRPVISLTLTMDGRQVEWSNPDAPVAVSIPYTPTAEELLNPECIVVWYIDGSGNVVTVPNGRYDPVSGTVSFSTTHFSDYAVAYNPVSFRDVAADVWYGRAVSFLAARGITSGTGDGNFSPGAELTRGDFMVLLLRAFDVSSDDGSADNFADAGNTYYTGYLAAAKRLGISHGVGNNRYAPEQTITRQEMFTLIYNAMRIFGRLSQGASSQTVSDYADAGQIAVWARDAMTALVENDIVSGSNGLLNPLKTATRAEMAQVLYNIMGK